MIALRGFVIWKIRNWIDFLTDLQVINIVLFLGLVDKFGDLVDTGKIIEFVAADSEERGLLGSFSLNDLKDIKSSRGGEWNIFTLILSLYVFINAFKC